MHRSLAAEWLVNGNFEAPSILSSGQTDVAVGSSKPISTNSASTGAISGIANWTYQLPDNGGTSSDHGIARPTVFGDASGPRMVFINNWGRMMSQTATRVPSPGDVAIASIQFGTAGSDPDGGRAGTFYLVAGEANGSNRDTFSARSIILDKVVVGNPTFTSVPRNLTVGNRILTTLNLQHNFTVGDPALGLPLTVAFRTESYSVGPTYWDNASLAVQSLVNPDIGVEQPAGSPLANAASTVDFGSVNSGMSAVRNFTIRNDGGANLSGLAVSVSGESRGDYSVTPPTVTALAPGASTVFSVLFTPPASAARNAILHIASNDPDDNPFDIALTGTRNTTLSPTFHLPTDIPVTATSFTAVGLTLAPPVLGFPPLPGQTLVLVNNTGRSPIGGTFDGLAEGTTMAVPYLWTSYRLAIHYSGGDGNDVVLVAAGTTLPPLRIESSGPNVSLRWPASTVDVALEATTDLPTRASWIELTNAPAVIGPDKVLTRPRTSAAEFFRLRGLANFYGKDMRLLKLFGQPGWGDTSPGGVIGSKIYHAAGVVVDRSAEPNRIYVADTGNNRILGFSSYSSQSADRVFGQPDPFSGAANGDSNFGLYGPTAKDKLCLLAYPAGTNVAEQWLRLNFDVDGAGNLYVPDLYNNRVVMYRAPFSADKSDGKGDPIADFVWGQPDFTSSAINHGLGSAARDDRSLYLSMGGFDHVSARGVSVDGAGNLWVADTFNYRVLRFSPGSQQADLVLGAPNFTLSDPAAEWAGNIPGAPLDRVCTPTLARVNPDTGELYVLDEFPGGFGARILVFTPPFSNGMAATRAVFPQQVLAGDFADGYRYTHATGLIFNPFKTNDLIDPLSGSTHRYRDGVFWLQANVSRLLLCDANGTILQAIGAPDTSSYGGSYEYYGRVGQDPVAPYSLISPGGMCGIDSSNNFYIADEASSRVARYALPYTVTQSGAYRRMPDPNGGMFGAFAGMVAANSVSPTDLGQDNVGVIPFGNQLIARDHQRYLVWNDYLTKSDGASPDLVVGQADGSSIAMRNHIMGRSMHAVDHLNRLWMTGEHGRLMCWQLPFVAGAVPIRVLVPFYWTDSPDDEVPYSCGIALTYEAAADALWVSDGDRHRLLRVRIPANIVTGKFLVDAVIGQANKSDGLPNRGMSAPDASSLGAVNDLTFDRLGNLFVVDNTYEGHPNGRVMAFLAQDLASINTLFPSIAARKLYVTESFDQTDINRGNDPIHGDAPFSPVCVAFNSRNEMVIANDGYYRDPRYRLIRQLYLYRNPMTKATPDAVIELPLGAPGEIQFDANDNLVVQDHTWNRVSILNFDSDPGWLRPLPLQ
ncbi:MAG: choice-of-anchor D domain-containing protein [Verrucomicrobia bacterium]|nr:choice-of-anchor D domain-containing protein [Verrucomicrobiota bacterium]